MGDDEIFFYDRKSGDAPTFTLHNRDGIRKRGSENSKITPGSSKVADIKRPSTTKKVLLPNPEDFILEDFDEKKTVVADSADKSAGKEDLGVFDEDEKETLFEDETIGKQTENFLTYFWLLK